MSFQGSFDGTRAEKTQVKEEMPQVAEQEAQVQVPDDVAALYAWAKLNGLKYHDFSAARKVSRADLRRRSAEAQREAQLRARAQAQSAALTQERGADAWEEKVSGGKETTPRTATKESMLPQRFPRRRQARDLAPPLPEASETRSRSALLEHSAVGVQAQVIAADEFLQGPAATMSAKELEAVAAEVQESSFARGDEGMAPGAEEWGSGSAPLPAWIYGDGTHEFSEGVPEVSTVAEPRGSASPVADTLQHSRERVASRWYALRGVFDPAAPAMEPTQAHVREGGSPILALFSLAGGVGKTSLTAALGRALSALGERVLLADVTAHGLLPFYFGSQELRTGIIRKFLPPAGSADAPIALVSYELSAHLEHGAPHEDMTADLAHSRNDFDRIVVDLSPAAPSMARGLVKMGATVLIPVPPDMNSVIGLAAVERFFCALSEHAGRSVQPRYLLTQFDSTLPLHLDVREVMRQQLGERLLPFVIRRSPAVSEALAEGMTVIDYAPEAPVADDYRDLATWIKSSAAPAVSGPKNARWSER